MAKVKFVLTDQQLDIIERSLKDSDWSLEGALVCQNSCDDPEGPNFCGVCGAKVVASSRRELKDAIEAALSAK